VRPADWITTNEHYYGFQELYPALYNAAAAATRAKTARNLSHYSEYSESLRNTSVDMSKSGFCSTYEATNKRLYPAQCSSTAQHAGFVDWVQKQRMYYGRLLNESAAARFEHVFKAAGAQQQATMLAALRLLYAVAQPDRLVATPSKLCSWHFWV
jgi:hypothetical protein